MDDEWDDGPAATTTLPVTQDFGEETRGSFGRRDFNSSGDDRPKREPRKSDWTCSECSANNFGNRSECFKCKASKPEGAGGDADNNNDYSSRPKREPRKGDWTCPECSQSNFGNRSECFKCQASKPEGLENGDDDSSNKRKGDWDCPSCQQSNFASRNECFKCQTEKPESAKLDENGEKRPELYIPAEPTEDETEIFNTGIASSEDFFKKQNEIPVSVSDGAAKPLENYETSGLREFLLENIKKSGYERPTPIQKYAIPTIMAGKDIMACAQTGSGKTAAYLLPILHNLLSDSPTLNVGKPHAVIVAPTRELAIQIFNECRKFSFGTYIKVQLAYGGTGSRYQSQKILQGCNIIVATPGRLLDFVDKGMIQFDEIRFVVLDEADRMLDMGFMPAMQKMMNHDTMKPVGEKQTLMFSATFPEEVQLLAGEFLKDYVFIAVGIVGGACSDVTQTFIEASRTDKRKKLMEIIEQEDPHMVMVFCETTRMADTLASFMSNTKWPTTSIHGKREQREREQALGDFRSGRMKVLITTSVCARGLDIKNVSHVINFDLPSNIDDYVHRIGRTGRVGNKGKATSLFDPDQDKDLVPHLIRILEQSKQPIPEFFSGTASAGGSKNDYGATDVRPSGKAELKPLEDDEDW